MLISGVAFVHVIFPVFVTVTVTTLVSPGHHTAAPVFIETHASFQTASVEKLLAIDQALVKPPPQFAR